MNDMEGKVLAALRANAESERVLSDGRVFASVYLDNVRSDLKLSARQLAGYLSALEGKGFYKVDDGECFGEVLMEVS